MSAEDDVAPALVGDRTRSPRRRLSLMSALVWFGSSYGGAVLGYVGVNALASRLLEERFGYFVIAVTVAMVTGQLGLFGMHRGGLREAARLGPEDVAELGELRATVRLASWVTLPATAGVVAVVTWAVSSGQPDRWGLALALAGLTWCSGQQKLWANYLRGLGRVRLAGMLAGRSGGALVALGQATGVSLVWWLIPGSGLVGALWAMIAGFLLPLAVAWFVIWRIWRRAVPPRMTRRTALRALAHYRHFAYSTAAGSVNAHLELWLAGALLSTVDTSLFSAANRIAMLLPIFIMSLGAVYSPLVSRLYPAETATLERLLRTGATCAVLVSSLLWVPVLLAPGRVAALLFGSTFADAAPLLVILTVGAMTNVATGMCQVALTMTEHEAVAARVQWVAVVSRLLLGLVLGTTFGVTGLAASATVITVLTWLALWDLARRRCGLRTHPTLHPEPRLMMRVKV